MRIVAYITRNNIKSINSHIQKYEDFYSNNSNIISINGGIHIKTLVKTVIIIFILLVTLAISYSKMSQYELSDVFLTTFTSLLILFTLFEMKNQREAIYKPDLILSSNKRFYMYKKNGNNDFVPILWSNKEVNIQNKQEYDELIRDNYNYDNKIEIDIFNIGMGAAKKVELQWEYNKEKVQKMIINEVNKDPTWIKSSNNPYALLTERKKNYDFDYILPSEISQEVKSISFPIGFKNDFSYALTVLLKNKKRNEIPKLNLKIIYQDLANQKCVKKFVFKFTLNSWEENIINQKFSINTITIDTSITEI